METKKKLDANEILSWLFGETDENCGKSQPPWIIYIEIEVFLYNSTRQ